MQRSVRSNPERIPLAALVLGIAGLIPFIALPAATLSRDRIDLPVWIGAHLTVPSLLLYAAVILSFMGGVQWGATMMKSPAGAYGLWRRYGVSVLPALLAWGALFVGTRMGLALLAVGFVLLLIYDIWTVRRGETPGWYEGLRLGLTSVVVVSITVTLVFIL